jgi:hypothetical protein
MRDRPHPTTSTPDQPGIGLHDQLELTVDLGEGNDVGVAMLGMAGFRVLDVVKLNGTWSHQ